MKYAIISAKLSAASYRDSVFEAIEGLRINRCHVVAANDELAMVCKGNGGVGYVVFRGTANKENWRSNFHILKLKMQYGMAHSGFVNGVNSLTNEIITELIRLKIKHIVVCGHSRGGAMAQLFAVTADLEGFEVVEVHVFGSPRVFSHKAADLFFETFGDRSWSWENNNDAVNRIPPKFLGYGDEITEMYFDSSGNYQPNAGFMTRLKGQIVGRIKGLFKLKIADGAEDHNSNHYVELLENNLPLPD